MAIHRERAHVIEDQWRVSRGVSEPHLLFCRRRGVESRQSAVTCNPDHTIGTELDVVDVNRGNSMMHARPNSPRTRIEPTAGQWLVIDLISRQHRQANFLPEVKSTRNP